MGTVLIQDGEYSSRSCDGKCHNAEGPECDCICGGKYHGIGREPTPEEVLSEEWEEGVEVV